jgi:hypothetical protein
MLNFNSNLILTAILILYVGFIIFKKQLLFKDLLVKYHSTFGYIAYSWT